VAETGTAPFKSGRRTKLRARHEAAVGTLRTQPRAAVAHREHLFGVRLPVRRETQYALGAQGGGEHLDETRIDQAAFVVTFFVPGIRKKN